MCLNDGLFLGFALQHCLTSNLKPSGHDDGIGKCRELEPTPQIMAEESTSLYGVSQDRSSHRTTPYDQISTFSEHGSLRMISGAIQATVPAKLIFVLTSFHSRLVPKSLILTTSSLAISTL